MRSVLVLVVALMGCTDTKKMEIADTKANILMLENYMHVYNEKNGHFPYNTKAFAKDRDVSLDAWGNDLEVIFKEEYESNGNTNTYEIAGKEYFYNPNTFQIFTRHPESGKVIGNFPKRKIIKYQ